VVARVVVRAEPAFRWRCTQSRGAVERGLGLDRRAFCVLGCSTMGGLTDQVELGMTALDWSWRVPGSLIRVRSGSCAQSR
jgi:hypothetical protein